MCFQIFEFGIDFYKLFEYCFHKFFEIGFGAFVAGFIFFEPLAVVVLFNVFDKGKGSRLQHVVLDLAENKINLKAEKIP